MRSHCGIVMVARPPRYQARQKSTLDDGLSREARTLGSFPSEWFVDTRVSDHWSVLAEFWADEREPAAGLDVPR